VSLDLKWQTEMPGHLRKAIDALLEERAALLAA
jgi:hypothetical protein